MRRPFTHEVLTQERRLTSCGVNALVNGIGVTGSGMVVAGAANVDLFAISN